MIGILIMAYGGPNSLEDVEPYLLDVRNYRPTSQEIIHEVRERYRQIGGRSPILERTRDQAQALETALNLHGEHFKTFVGMRHWHPFIDQTLADMSAAGIEKAIGLVMAPHYSRLSIGAYIKKIQAAETDLEIEPIEHWHLLSGYLDALAGRVQAALERFPVEIRDGVPVIFTAHSLPERILGWNDPYADELNATVVELGKRLGSNPYQFAYQSAAISSDPWLGPDAGEVIERLASEGCRHVLIAPIGFVCEHVEVLYDVDIVFKGQAKSLGIQLERIEMLNTAPGMINSLAGLVLNVAKEKKWL
jgi:protoporphyrin/coproporphyrin ferrochelatase